MKHLNSFCNWRTFWLFLMTLAAFHLEAQTLSVISPDQKNGISLTCKNSIISYEVIHNREVIIQPSMLGFKMVQKSNPTDTINYSQGFKIDSTSEHYFHEIWEPVWGTDRFIDNTYNERIVSFSNSQYPDIKLQIITRAYSDGVAFRYHLENTKIGSQDSIFVLEELTHFNFSQNDSAWFAPAADFAYESIYKNMPLSEIKDAATPMTICRPNLLTICIHEATLTNYSEFYLKRNGDGKPQFVSTLWPERDGVCARLSFPFQTPWRVIIITENPAKLMESHLVQNLNQPSVIKNTEWIKPMKFVGIWWGMHTGKYTWSYGEKHGATTERTKKYIDFAAQHHIEGVLAEGWNVGWETWNSVDYPYQNYSQGYPDFNLKEVVEYGKLKNVHFVSHHETGGNIPEYEKQLDSAFQLCQNLGIRYLKTGYAGKIIPHGYAHHGQYMVNHFQKVVEKAAQYQICLDVHESIKPTGLDRTWPNLMSQEAIRGNEWNGGYKPTPPSHTTILPFTRYIAGPADYTPGIFNTKHTPEKGKRLVTTRAHQMALMVVFFSPMAMVSDVIESYESQPEFEFMEEVPSSWDQTKVLNCQIGQFVSVARKSGEKWYIGTITNEKCRIVPIGLDFLDSGKSYQVTIYGDGFQNDWENNPDRVEIESYLVTAQDSIIIPLSQGSGNVMIFESIKLPDVGKYRTISEYNKLSTSKFTLYNSKKYTSLSQEIIKHKGYNCYVRYYTPYNQKYSGEGKTGLTNGKLGTYNFFEEWQGFEGTDIELELVFDSIQAIISVEVRFLNAINDWIFLPDSVILWGGDNTKKEEKLGTFYFSSASNKDYNLVEFKSAIFELRKKKLQFIKIKVFTQKSCPEWHYGNGKSCWTFMDEILIH